MASALFNGRWAQCNKSMKYIFVLTLMLVLTFDALCQSKVGLRGLNQQEPNELEKIIAKYPECKHEKCELIEAEYKKGGYPGFYRYIKRNMIYPEDAKANKLEGTVYVKFIITETGQVDPDYLIVVRGVNDSLDEEAIRLIKESGPWKPATDYGLPRAIVKIMPIKFSLK